ncbi:MAG TPA: hypothetical protein PKM47_19130 [Mycobacterium sp.]|nr:hypothetical protein [Mycobacterium sp.]
MTETPESTVATPETLAVADPDGRQRPNRLYQALAWVGIVAGVLFIVGMVFFAGVFLGRTGGYGWHRGYHTGQMGPGGPGAECPMMRGGGMGPGMMGPGGMDPDDMGPGGMMGPGRSPASTAPAPPPAQRPS